LVSYNILVGGRGRLDAIASVLARLEPDVVILEEVYNPQSAGTLARALDMPNWCARERHSMAVLSRLPVRQCRWHATPVSRRRVLEVGLPGLTVFGVHLQPYFFRYSEAQRLREVQALLAMLTHYRELPHVVVGDFNSVAPGEKINLRRMPLWVGALLFLTGGQFDLKHQNKDKRIEKTW
jgi:exodeoxyribonuclease-3